MRDIHIRYHTTSSCHHVIISGRVVLCYCECVCVCGRRRMRQRHHTHTHTRLGGCFSRSGIRRRTLSVSSAWVRGQGHEHGERERTDYRFLKPNFCASRRHTQVCVCVGVWVGVREREGERECARETGCERWNVRECVCVSVRKRV